MESEIRVISEERSLAAILRSAVDHFVDDKDNDEYLKNSRIRYANLASQFCQVFFEMVFAASIQRIVGSQAVRFLIRNPEFF